MMTMLQNWNGQVKLNGKLYNGMGDINVVEAIQGSEFHMVLLSKTRRQIEKQPEQEKQKTYKITVKKYMTQKSSPGFDFMSKWNNDEPMPLRTMIGTIDKQTPGMYHMTLHGDILAEKTCYCMRCGKELKNPVSQYFGIGPECGNHGYVNPFNSDEELRAAVESYRKQLQNMTWTGWVIKSAITEMEEIQYGRND